ncbi:MAG TPA: type IV secretory system conjugative DNA transfer family protein, partial [Chloroflexota bacterium]|nr:type IV secretory system conjugative DNA transfer family protein [Chloroflexota bacterium]
KTSADDAEWFSRGTGAATVLSYSAGDNRKRGDRLARSGNRGVSEIGRPLLTPDEVTRLPEDTMLVLSGNRQPILVRQRRWYRDRRLRKLARTQPLGHGLVAPEVLVGGERWDAEEFTATVEPMVAATSVATASSPTPDDGAIRLDHGLPAGEATWVVAPEDLAPTTALAPVGATGRGTAAFELPEDR